MFNFIINYLDIKLLKEGLRKFGINLMSAGLISFYIVPSFNPTTMQILLDLIIIMLGFFSFSIGLLRRK